jgi:DNA-binding response OmpR family regulator
MAGAYPRSVELLLVGVASERLRALLRATGHIVRLADGPGEAELAQRSGRVDVAVCEADFAQLRRRLESVPVAVWLPTASTAAVAEALEAGADEVVHAGMGDRELAVRIAALARRAPAGAPPVELGPLRVDRDRGEATWHGRRLALTARERDVLYELSRAGGATVRRETIYRAVWGYAMTRGDRSVDVNVKRLRDKLAAEIGAPVSIETEPGVGYRLALSQLRNDAVTEL